MFDISVINSKGDVEDEVHRVTGQCFYGIISACNNYKKTHCIHDSTVCRTSVATDSMIEEIDESVNNGSSSKNTN